MERQDDLRRSANDLLLVERAKEWLLEDEGMADRFGSPPRGSVSPPAGSPRTTPSARPR